MRVDCIDGDYDDFSEYYERPMFNYWAIQAAEGFGQMRKAQGEGDHENHPDFLTEPGLLLS